MGPSQLGKIRMAFVGFKSSAAGHFAVSYYNNSYLRSRKLKVELAKGLNEVGVTLNIKKKLELQEQHSQKRPREGADVKGREAFPNAAEDPSAQRSTGAEYPVQQAGEDEAPEGNDALPSSSVFEARKKTRKELFVEERTHATEGPSWSAEVLVPPSPAQQQQQGREEQRVTGNDEGDSAMDEEERERRALEKQQALGAVSDLDFLSQLGNGAQNANGKSRGATHSERRISVAAGDDTHGEHQNSDDNTQQEQHQEGQGEGQGGESSREATKSHAEGEECSPEGIARLSRRVRIGNIPYTATEEQVKQFAASLVGPVDEAHIPLTKDTRQSKGAAFVKFVHAEDAVRALTLCRGAILMGRLLRVSAAEEDPHSRRALERDAREATATGGVGGTAAGLAGSSAFKIRKEMDRRGEATGGCDGGGGANSRRKTSGDGSHVSWNTMYMNSSAAVGNVAQRLGVQADDLVSVQVKGAAVRAAIAEAYLTSEIQQVLSDEGVAFDVIESGQQSLLKTRSNTTILVKNLQLTGPDDAKELSKLFVRFGTLETSVFPSSGTFALLRFSHPQDARTAFTRLSYKLFKNAPLFLEWAPVGAIVEDDAEDSRRADADAGKPGAGPSPNGEATTRVGDKEDDDDDGDGDSHAHKLLPASAVVYTAFITNIPFAATEADFHTFLLDSCPRLAKAPEDLIKRLVFQQQQGRAYLTLADASTYRYCLGRLNGKSFEGRTLSCVASKQTELDAVATKSSAAPTKARSSLAVSGVAGDGEEEEEEERQLRKTAAVAASHTGAGASGSARVPPDCDPYKIVVKNVPFEATEADIRELFSAFSEVKSVRLPRKVNNFTKHRENNHRGFAFVEFLSATEAARAIEVLRATHLYGRHLVLQYAKRDG